MFWSIFGRGTGIRFDERMGGWFAFGEYDCEVGAMRGRRDRTRLGLVASIEIDDLTHFIDAPRHRAKIDGRLTFGATAAVASGCGPLVLFEPALDPNYVLMTYQLVFPYNDAQHFLAGTKLIPRRRPLSLWTATTTLDVQLHRSADASGPIVGAGQLHLSVANLLKLVASMQAVEAGRARSTRATCLSFLVFFAKQLLALSFRSPGRTRRRTSSPTGNAARESVGVPSAPE